MLAGSWPSNYSSENVLSHRRFLHSIIVRRGLAPIPKAELRRIAFISLATRIQTTRADLARNSFRMHGSVNLEEMNVGQRRPEKGNFNAGIWLASTRDDENCSRWLLRRLLRTFLFESLNMDLSAFWNPLIQFLNQSSRGKGANFGRYLSFPVCCIRIVKDTLYVPWRHSSQTILHVGRF